jgi:hypothetical protein
LNIDSIASALMAQDFVGWTLAEAIERVTGAKRPEDGADRFWTMVQENRLRLFGRPASRAEPQPISAAEIASLEIRDYEGSQLAGVDPRSPAYRTVVCFPTIHSPDAINVLDRMSIREAFQKFVLDDPELVMAHAKARKSDPQYDSILRLFQHAMVLSGKWPLILKRSRVVRDPEDRDSWPYLIDGPVNRYVARAQQILFDRQLAFFAPLVAGRLVAVGDPARRGDAETILSTIWSHQSYYLDFWKGDVVQIDENSENPPADLFKCRWRAVQFRRAAPNPTAGLQPVLGKARGEWTVVIELTEGEDAVFRALQTEFPFGTRGGAQGRHKRQGPRIPGR